MKWWKIGRKVVTLMFEKKVCAEVYILRIMVRGGKMQVIKFCK